MISYQNFFYTFIVAALLVFGAISWSNETNAGELQLTWSDNSNNEDGFKIERKSGTAGTYAQIATAGANVSSYTDLGLIDNATYCYRLSAFNSAGSSPYSSEICAPARPTVQNFALSLTKSGTGGGNITTAPAGINCGTICSGSYNSGTIVTLTATPVAGSTFASWSGDADCSDGSVTMTASINCTATFNVQTPSTYGLIVSKAGTGSGTVTSSPAGINCGSDCSEAYKSGTPVTLTPTAAAGSNFSGWSGNADCSDGSVTMTASINCTATFNVQTPATYGLIVSKAGAGSGTVTSSPPGINCGGDCSEAYNRNTLVTLVTAAASGSVFHGWSGTGCTNGLVTMTGNMTCTATFNKHAERAAYKIGIFRPATGQWFLDRDGNGALDCEIDVCLTGYGKNGMLPIVGDWYGEGQSGIGTFDPATGSWHLDNGNGTWDSCGTNGDMCVTSFGQPGDFPVVKESSSDQLIIGIFQPEITTINAKGRKITKRGVWKFDTDGDGAFEGCGSNECFENFGTLGDLPVVGDWNDTGTEQIGFFRPSTGRWFLDLNGNGKWDGRDVDKLLTSFGRSGDLPVVGDWDGTGKMRIGVFRPNTAQWFLDLNGNGKWDGCQVDTCLGPFGQSDDLPVVGRW